MLIFQNLIAERDRLILYEDSGFLMNDTTGFTTINQRAQYVLGGTEEDLQGCFVSNNCCKCATESCNTAKLIEDFTIVFKKISKSSTLRLAKVSTTLSNLIFNIKAMFKETDEPLSREQLAKDIATTFTIFEESVSDQTDAIGIVSNEIIKLMKNIQSDLLRITEAMSVKNKDAAARDLGNHIICLMDATAELTKLTTSVSTLVTDKLCEGIHSITLTTSIIFFFVHETVAVSTVQVNKVGFKNDIASTILTHICVAVEHLILVIQHMSQCHDVQSLRNFLPTVTTSLCTAGTKLIESISSTIGFDKKYPVSPALYGIVDCVIDCVRGSKHLKEAQAVISETIVSFFEICNTILAARFSCSCIKGFIGNVDVSIRKVLQHVNTIFIIIANIDDDIFSCSNSLLMFLTTLNLAIVKVMSGIDKIIQSILSSGEIADGSSSLIGIFEAVVDVVGSVVQCVAFMFFDLVRGSHLIDISNVITGIIYTVKIRIDTARVRLEEKLDTGISNSDSSDIYKEASTVILSYMESKHNIDNVACSFHSEGNDPVDDSKTVKVDMFIGKLKSCAERLSHDGIGSAIAATLNEICDEVYDVLILLSSVTLEKWEVLSIVWMMVGNYFYGVASLTSIINCLQGDINVSIY